MCEKGERRFNETHSKHNRIHILGNYSTHRNKVADFWLCNVKAGENNKKYTDSFFPLKQPAF